jgi:DNA-binding CsgD family transcriptional regulator
MHVVGRGPDLFALDGVLRDPTTAAAVVSGPAGIGKTTVVDAVVGRLRDELIVLYAHAVAGESGLPYGVLATLLAPHHADIAALPDGQREALEVALALRSGDPVRELAVCLATTNLILSMTSRARVLMCVDDVQEIDAASATVVAYALRRVVPGQAAALLAYRSGTSVPPALLDALPPDTLHHGLSPMDDETVRELLRTRFGTAVSPGRVVEAARGNPLAAVEFAKAEVSGRPVASRVTELLRRRLRDQPPPVLDLLVVVAAAGRLPMSVAQDLLPDFDEPLASAVEAEILTAEGTIGFAHPLMAEAMTDVAGLVAVRTAHKRLAGSDLLPVEQRARHALAATAGPDEGVAAMLTKAAAGARRRGAPGVAAELAELAVRATHPREIELRRRRALDCARFALEAADGRRVARVLDELEMPLDHAYAAEFFTLRHWAPAFSDLGESLRDLDQAVLAGKMGDPWASRANAQRALDLLTCGRVAEAHRSAREAVALATTANHPWQRQTALQVQHSIEAYGLLGDADGTLATLCGSDPPDHSSEDADVLAYPGSFVGPHGARFISHVVRGEFDEAAAVMAESLRLTLQFGDTGSAYLTEALLAQVLARAGRIREADAAVDRMAEYGVSPPFDSVTHRVNAIVAACRGDLDGVRAAAPTAIAVARGGGALRHLVNPLWAVGHAELAAGNAIAALAALDDLRSSVDGTGFRITTWTVWQADYIEAALAVGATAHIDEVYADLCEIATITRYPRLATLASRSQALLLEARDDVEAALEVLASLSDRPDDHVRLEYGRTQLAYGRLARRLKKRGLARDALSGAVETFRQVENPLWERRAVEELARTGVRTEGALTRTEASVAELVATGQTNRQIAGQLHLSVKTVEYTLTGVYRKMGVANRAQLTARLAGTRETSGSPGGDREP